MPFRRTLRLGIVNMVGTDLKFEPIGVVRSGFKEKFGIPRQSRLAKSARAEIRLPLAKFRDAIDGLEDFSHVWVIFVFHQALNAKVRVRPPVWEGPRNSAFSPRAPRIARTRSECPRSHSSESKRLRKKS